MNAEKVSASLSVQDDAVAISTVGKGSVGVQLSGTWTGTVTFEGTIDGTNWVAIKGTPLASTTGASTATQSGLWQVPVSGLNQFRARFSTASSGAVVVTLQSSQAEVTKY